MKLLQHAGGTATVAVLVGTLVALTGVGCSSAQPTDDPGVDRLGQYMLINNGPEAEVAIGYRHAQNNLGSDWVLLEMAATSPSGQTATFERDRISLLTPAGATIPLATQAEFGADYSKLRPFLNKADIARDPMDFWPPRKRILPLQFFAEPGTGVVFDEISVNDFRAVQGRLMFRVPGGVQPGRYVLSIKLEESEVRIPFTLED
ncbi:MAG: hypothetical protein PVG53_10200 [Holophagae bacterium]|jgi:hypothetical protein